jgi:hypothetical protein
VPRPSGESCQKMPQFQLYFTGSAPPQGGRGAHERSGYL